MPRACLALAGLDTRIFNAYHSDSGYAHSVANIRQRWFLGGPPMTFRIGEKVVYPNQGVGTSRISAPAPLARARKVLSASLRIGGTTVWVPFSHASNIGLRRVTKDREIFAHPFLSLQRLVRHQPRLEGALQTESRETARRRSFQSRGGFQEHLAASKSTSRSPSREGNARPRVSHA